MSTQPEVVSQSQLLNQLVLNRSTMEELGRIEVLWMYAPSHRVLGFVCKTGFLGNKKFALNLGQVDAIGNNGILTHSKPEETDAEKVRQLETVIDCEVWTDAGEKMGKISDYLFRLKTGEITKYLMVSGGWGGVTGEVYELPPHKILSIGRRRILVANSVANGLSVHQTSIKHRIEKVADTLKGSLKDEYSQVTQEFQSLSEQARGRIFGLREQLQKRAQTLSQQAKEKVQNLGEQLQETTQSFTEQLQETTHNLTEQLQETTQSFTEQARERSQTLAEQVRERGQAIGEQVEEGIQTLTVQAREILDPAVDETEWEDDWDITTPPVTEQAITTPMPTQPEPETLAEPPTSPPLPEVAEPELPAVDVSSLEDDLWDDDPPAPTVEPPLLAETPAATTATVPAAANDQDDDEPWI